MCNDMKDRWKLRKPWRFIFAIPLFIIFLALAGYIFMNLWNAVIPDIFNIKQIEFWQAIGLIIISRILFGGIGHAHHHHHRFGARHWECRKKENANDKEAESGLTGLND